MRAGIAEFTLVAASRPGALRANDAPCPAAADPERDGHGPPDKPRIVVEIIDRIVWRFGVVESETPYVVWTTQYQTTRTTAPMAAHTSRVARWTKRQRRRPRTPEGDCAERQRHDTRERHCGKVNVVCNHDRIAAGYSYIWVKNPWLLAAVRGTLSAGDIHPRGH